LTYWRALSDLRGPVLLRRPANNVTFLAIIIWPIEICVLQKETKSPVVLGKGILIPLRFLILMSNGLQLVKGLVLRYLALMLCCLSLSCLVSCTDAERKNPLDPQSPIHTNSGSLAIEVMTYYAPHLPVSDVLIHLQPGAYTNSTDIDGRLVVDDITAGRYLLQITKPGYATIEDSIVVEPGVQTDTSFTLDALPAIESLAVRSARIKRWFPQDDLLLLEVQSEITDADGPNDISAVMVKIPGLGFADTLDVAGASGSFSLLIPEASLPGRNLQLVLGQQIFIRAVDLAGFEAISSPRFLARIIDLDVLQFSSPQSEEVVDPMNLELVWQPIDLPFPYTFRVEVSSYNINLITEVWRRNEISADEVSTLVPVVLPDGPYIWTLSAVDEFGNYVRSKPASFIVPQ